MYTGCTDTMKGTRSAEDSPSSLMEHALDLTPVGTDSVSIPIDITWIPDAIPRIAGHPLSNTRPNS